jgi:hypothetical protein
LVGSTAHRASTFGLNLIEAKQPPEIAKSPASRPPGALFHEDWWLHAATGGRYQEVTVTSGSAVVGRLPFVTRRRMGFTELRMPPFTHVLGPAVEPGSGKYQTQLSRRLSIIRALIDQLPKFDYFKQAIDWSISDGLAFQDRGFRASVNYTFEIDCRRNLDDIWRAMNFKVRQHIRRAEEKLSVAPVADPNEFLHFYMANLQQIRRTTFIEFATFPDAFSESQARDSGEILCARWPDGKPAAMVYLVWGHGTMYYLLSTRAHDRADNGSVNLLIWSAVKRAHERGLLFDLDGVSTTGTARFLSGFGGQLKARIIVERSSLVYGAIQHTRRRFISGRSSGAFTSLLAILFEALATLGG